jgi:hypothetical protein
VYVDTFVDGNDPLRPRLLRYPNTPTRIRHDNPDNVYQAALIRGDRRYVVRGNVGSVHFISFSVYSGFTRYKDLRTVSSPNSFDLEADAEGDFEVVLSAEPEPGNSLKLEPDAAVLVVRQLFYDWEREREARVSIRNTADLPSAPPLDAAQMAQRLDNLGRFVSSVRRFFDDKGPTPQQSDRSRQGIPHTREELAQRRIEDRIDDFAKAVPGQFLDVVHRC